MTLNVPNVSGISLSDKIRVTISFLLFSVVQIFFNENVFLLQIK